MNQSVRRNHALRLEAYDALQELKHQGVSKTKIVEKIHEKFNIPRCALYTWLSGKLKPFGRRGTVQRTPELLYVLGALLGDGCAYKGTVTRNDVILVGDKSFTTKYAQILNRCIEKPAKPYIIRSKNIWFVTTNNYELFTLFKQVRQSPFALRKLLKEIPGSPLLFVEGFFDAEGCVKVVKEQVRKTPKICLDFTNTDCVILEQVRLLLREELGIEARYSIQKAIMGSDGSPRQLAYHLRIYKKVYIRRFFSNMTTTKLTPEKAVLLKNWLNNGK